jgi:hypothetical protein
MNRKSCSRTLLLLALGAVAMLALPAVAAARDRNHDRIPDRWEKHHHLSLKANQAQRDQDRDSLRNRAEFLAGDDPRDEDSDDDGVMDGEENAGTVKSFDAGTGRLVISLFGGETVSGVVTQGTEIKCEDRHAATASHSGEAEEGDDRGDRGEEAEDDRGGKAEAGDDPAGPGGEDRGDAGANCTTANLVEGAVVHEAELEVEHGVTSFDEVELAG